MNVGFRYLKKECKVNKPTVETITECNVVEFLQCGLHGEKKKLFSGGQLMGLKESGMVDDHHLTSGRSDIE